jgi:hypothetical protein
LTASASAAITKLGSQGTIVGVDGALAAFREVSAGRAKHSSLPIVLCLFVTFQLSMHPPPESFGDFCTPFPRRGTIKL